MHENEIGTIVVETAIAVHRALGPGLLESVYRAVMAHELARAAGARTEVPISIQYKSIKFDEGFRADIVIEERVIVELKSVEKVNPATRSNSRRTSV